MLPGGTDTLYRRLLARNVRPYIRVDVLDGNGVQLPIPAYAQAEEGGLRVGDGSNVSASLQSRVTRQASISVDQSWYPDMIDGLLAPYGNRLLITAGVVMGDGSNRYTWTVFTGRIQSTGLGFDGTVTVTAADRAYEVAEAGFLYPTNSQVGNPVTFEFQRLVDDAVDDAVFGPSDYFPDPMPQLTWQDDRAGALDEIAAAVGCYWFCLADGSFVLRRIPWTYNRVSDATVSDGTDGIIVAEPSRLRDDVYNSVTATGERADGSAPVYALAEDLNPVSPTFVNGPFGRRHYTLSLQTPQTQGTAQTAANAFLRSSVALQEVWTWTQPVDAALELGDAVTVEAFDREGVLQVVAGFTLPLTVGESMTVQAHPPIGAVA
jgi:hypothetical protein